MFSLKNLSTIVNVLNKLEGEELLKQVQKIVSVLNNIKKNKKTVARSPFSRKLLSLDPDQCDSDQCLEEAGTVTEKEEEQDGIEDIDDSDEDEADDIEDDEDLLDADELSELLANKELSEKISTMNDVLDDLESLFEPNLQDIDEDLYVSAIQSLIVYIYSVEEMQETPQSKQSPEDSVLLQKLSVRMKEMKKTYLTQVTHFEMFFSTGWKRFREIIDEKIVNGYNREAVEKINEFAFNFHYAKEIERIIRRRAIEDEVDIIDEYKDDLGLMQQVYDHLGFGEETQDEGYFSRMLSGIVSEDDEDDEETHKNRKLLSIAEPDSEGYCSVDDTDCGGPSESLSIKREVSEADRPQKTDLDICEDLLQRTQEVGQVNLENDQLAVLTGSEKVQYIKSYIKKLKESRQIVGDYQRHLKSIADPQDYNKCYRLLETDLGKLQSQTANTAWLKHLASLIASNNKEVLSELSDITTDVLQADQHEEIGRDSPPAFRKRNLLSVKDEEEFCEKDDVQCREKSRFSGDLKHAQQYSDKEQAVENLKQELRDSYEETKVSDENKEGKKSTLLRCQELLTKSEQEMTKFQQNKSKNKDLKKMKPKQKMKIIREFMTQMTVTKTLFDEHREITRNLHDLDERQFCQPILKVCGSKTKLNGPNDLT